MNYSNSYCQHPKVNDWTARFMELYSEYFQLVYFIAKKFHPQYPDDVTQDVFEKIFRTLKKSPEYFQVDDKQVRALLASFTKNHCIDTLRSLKVNPPSEEFIIDRYEQPSSSRLVDEFICNDLRKYKFSRLTEGQFKVMTLFEKGYKYKEIAVKLGLSLRSVKNRIYRARQILTTCNNKFN